MKIIKCLLLIIVLTCSSVSAMTTVDRFEVVNTIVGIQVKQTLQIEGSADTEYIGLVIANPNVNIESVDMNDVKKVNEAFLVLKDIQVTNGRFVFSYPITKERGTYRVKISSNNTPIIREIDIEAFSLDETLLIELNKVFSYGEIIPFIQKYNSVLNINLTNYNRLNDASKALKTLVGKSYSSVQMFKDDFNKAVDAQLESQNTRGGGNTGSGGVNTGISISKDTNATLQPPTLSTSFNDLDSVLWAKDSIEFLVKNGSINGDGKGNFRPNDFVTREQFAKILAISFNFPQSNGKTKFSDVPEQMWYYQHVMTLNNLNVATGTSGEMFGVGEYITREDMAAMVYRALNVDRQPITLSDELTFKDAGQISDYATVAVGKMTALGIINGNVDGEFLPKNNATRAEAAKVIALAVMKSGVTE